jgi:hypothetical protein
MIVEIALGIVLAVIILMFLPFIIAGGLILIGIAVLVIVLFLVYSATQDVKVEDLAFIPVLGVLILSLMTLPTVLAAVFMNIPVIQRMFATREPLGKRQDEGYKAYAKRLQNYYWLRGYAVLTGILFIVIIGILVYEQL